MQRLKFRAWHREYKVIAPVLRLDFICNQVWVDVAMYTDENDEPLEHKWDIDNIELMQFTTLQDDNLKDIYAGDIIESCHRLFTIELIMGMFLAVPIKKDGPAMNIYALDGFVAVGNIYSNPELLEVK